MRNVKVNDGHGIWHPCGNVTIDAKDVSPPFPKSCSTGLGAQELSSVEGNQELMKQQVLSSVEGNQEMIKQQVLSSVEGNQELMRQRVAVEDSINDEVVFV